VEGFREYNRTTGKLKGFKIELTMIEVMEGGDTVFSRFNRNVDGGSIINGQGRKTVDKNSRGGKS
jgi:hypothetical protein